MEVYTVTEAKNNFPKLRRLAAQGNEFIVVDHKRAETASVSVIATELLDKITNEALANLTYEWLDQPGDRITDDEMNQTWTLWNEQLRIYGVGKTKEEAIRSLAEDAVNYANEYFDDLEFFLNPRSERDTHYWVLRGIRYCDGDLTKVIKVMRLNEFLEV
ncbi:MAG: hypothetical protein PHS83_00175 [Clostridia bacterium]|jgi:hypothetical protein|nr:hypothetical protein [Clostridia bacterium]MDD4145520.1 hypothetical protein [Clostridia bacterium]MDD4665017.1 hypothetical protein [Clostridia bacterium]